jgi:hypothetical protein
MESEICPSQTAHYDPKCVRFPDLGVMYAPRLPVDENEFQGALDELEMRPEAR